MAIDCIQLRDVIIKPVLTALGMNSPSAVNLLLGTAAQESHLGQYIIQVGNLRNRGGIGIYQMEQRTYDNLWEYTIQPEVLMRIKLKNLLGYDGKPPATRMASDLFLATAMARLLYHSIERPLPQPDDILGLADYWKLHYNSLKGKGTTQQFVENYHYYVENNT